jgi:pimeloyl-ACP methyl ester carboxylesterase
LIVRGATVTATVMEPRSGFYTARRLRLHYLEWGDPAAPPVILVHGGRDHARSWDAIAAGLAGSHRVIVADLAGHGDSEWTSSGDYPINGYAFDIAHLITLLGIERLALVGHSLGGHVVLRIAAARPELVTRLVSIEGIGPPPAILAQRAGLTQAEKVRGYLDDAEKMETRHPRHYATIDAALERMREQNAHLSPELALHLTRHGLRENADGSWSWKFDNRFYLIGHERATEEELIGLWTAVACPTLLIYGAESWASNPAKDGRAAYFSDVRVELLENAGHWPHHDRAEAVLPMIRDFVAG